MRRSTGANFPDNSRPKILLLDTTGELSAAWGLATIAFVGGSLDGKRGGQNPIEPAAFGLPVCFGPHVWNFKDITAQLKQAGGAQTISTTGDVAENLANCLSHWLQNPEIAQNMGQAGRNFVAAQQGATNHTLDFLDHRGLTQLAHSNRQAG